MCADDGQVVSFSAETDKQRIGSELWPFCQVQQSGIHQRNQQYKTSIEMKELVKDSLRTLLRKSPFYNIIIIIKLKKKKNIYIYTSLNVLAMAPRDSQRGLPAKSKPEPPKGSSYWLLVMRGVVNGNMRGFRSIWQMCFTAQYQKHTHVESQESPGVYHTALSYFRSLNELLEGNGIVPGRRNTTKTSCNKILH